jgi:hypothetical protein
MVLIQFPFLSRDAIIGPEEAKELASHSSLV